MTNDIFLSITVETYNQELYIARTLDSILQQEYNFSYEIIIGDDCSTDKTPIILDEYAEKYPQIKVVHNADNLGPMGNFYNLIQFCHGKYLMDCAGDDWWLPGKIQTQIAFMEMHEDFGMCYGKAKVWNEDKEQYEKESCGGERKTFDDFLEYNNVPALTVCIRNTIYQQYLSEIKPEKKDWKMEDYPAWLWFSKESKIKFFDKEFAVYRLLRNSVSHNVDIEKQLAFERNVSEIKNYYRVKYEYPIVEFNEEETRINIVYSILLTNYSETNMKTLRELLNKKSCLSRKQKIIKCCTRNKCLFILFLKLKGLSKLIRI